MKKAVMANNSLSTEGGEPSAWARKGSRTKSAAKSSASAPESMIELPITSRPKSQRPRERMLKLGEGALADEELVAVLLRTGKPGQSAIAMAAELIHEHGGIGGLLWTDIRRMRRYGLGPAKAASIMAAVELSRRLTRASLSHQSVMDRPESVARYLYLRYGKFDQEVMGALFVDMRNHLIDESEIFRGTLTRAAVEPRAILREALLVGAAGLLLFHTHPSGDPGPSQEDLDFTFRMAQACELMGVRLMDHLIVGNHGSWVSLKQRGAW